MAKFQPTRTTLRIYYLLHLFTLIQGLFGLIFLAAVGIALIPALTTDENFTNGLSYALLERVHQLGLPLLGGVVGIWVLHFITKYLIVKSEAYIGEEREIDPAIIEGIGRRRPAGSAN